ncbi:uncharacterized protein LOC107771255 [Nicotiana tabacum]|uniref:Uncharacterized protein LOC107771255 n=1 Tax=Nicotiana tabacum TaxID=4097 RepID=A0A1S3Y1S5_TOBAC|nr:PREDICTED: uncharacterized protein LOC107771255 [Nicotiana tabacum]
MSSSSGVTDNSTVTHSSPLYLLPSDSPGTILVTTTFDGTSCGSWHRGMLLGLSCKNKLGLINGTVARPSSTSLLFEPWIRYNDMVVAWILNSLDREIRETVMYTESAEKLWKEIERRFVKLVELRFFRFVSKFPRLPKVLQAFYHILTELKIFGMSFLSLYHILIVFVDARRPTKG